jgi:hypothetical protein
MNKNMKYVNDNLALLEQDVVSGRVSFETGMDCVPVEEKERFLRRLNRFISGERLKVSPPERLVELKALDELVTSAIAAAQLKRASRAGTL